MKMQEWDTGMNRKEDLASPNYQKTYFEIASNYTKQLLLQLLEVVLSCRLLHTKNLLKELLTVKILIWLVMRI